MSEVVFLVSKK